MRKCPECGYLLLGDGDKCNHCGAALAVPTAVEPAAAAASGVKPLWKPSPPPVSAPHPVQPGWAAAPPPPGYPAAPPASTSPATEFWRPAEMPAPPRRATRSPSKRVLSMVVAIAAGLAGAGVARSWHGDDLPPGTSAFVGGRGVQYTAQDQSYIARLPQQPTEDQSPITVGSLTATLSSALIQTNDYELGTASILLPVAVGPEKVDDVLNGAMTGGIVGSDGKLVSDKRLTRGGYPAKEATFKAPDGYSAHILVMVHGNHMWVEFVHAKSGTDRLYKALDASFVPIAAADG